MTINDKITLLPCAHCGSNDVHLCRCIVPDGFPAWYIVCNDCEIQTATYPEDTDFDEDDKAIMAINDAITCAVEIWNNRADCAKCEQPSAGNESNHYDDDKYKPYSADEFKPIYDLLKHIKSLAKGDANG